jgi:carbon monoxide dehydrogenase subunit G
VQLEESFELPFPRETVWAAFKDIELLVSCLPGAALESALDASPLKLSLSVKLGPIAAKFAGEGAVTYRDETCSGVLSGNGADRATNSRVKGTATFALDPGEESTRVKLDIDYALTGALAQVGRPGIVKEVAAKLTQQFATNLKTRIAERSAQPPAANAHEPVAPGSAPPQALNAGSLIWSVLWGRVKQLFGIR